MTSTSICQALKPRREVSFFCTRVDLLVSAILLCAYPLASVLPVTAGWENGAIENIQALVLCFCALICFYANSKKTNSLCLPAGMTFLLMFLRELSWGRVLLTPTRITDMGPVFPAMKDIPFHSLINFGIGVLIVLTLYQLYKRFSLSWFTSITFPLFPLVLILISILLQHIGEHHLAQLLSNPQGQVMEELAELAIYFELAHLSFYYLGKEKSKQKTTH